jgi:2,3-bisphosphoglycerate-dependent phosphoglycerate mutase
MTGVKLILLRHGQSEWNRLNLFTGWVDVPLSAQGVEEAFAAGKKIAHLPVDVVYTSSLIRAQMTATLALVHHSSGKVPCFMRDAEPSFQGWSHIYSEKAEKQTVPVYTAWQLNERMYGQLQGLNKQETREQYGDEQVHIWRRSFDKAPPQGESLEMTANRAVPYFQSYILPRLIAGENVLVSAHGNSLRAIIMFLDRLSPQEVVNLELATGEPIIYTFKKESWTRDG